MKTEVCVTSLQEVLQAKERGEESLTLCSGLTEGGLTPSYGLIRHACAVENLKVHVLIRPRNTDGPYDDCDRDVMLQDITSAKFLGADGIIAGALNADASVDAAFTKQCVDAAYPLPFSFSRAFDKCRDKFEALQVLQYCGCSRVLTEQPSRELADRSTHIEIIGCI